LLQVIVLQAQPGAGYRFSAPEEGLELLEQSPHQLTLYVIPPKVKYDWSSPNRLYNSLKKNYIRHFFVHKNYLLGHAFVELRTPLAEQEVFAGMRVLDLKQERQYLLKENYGLSILGCDLEGHMENAGALEEKVRNYGRRGNLAFMTLLINEDAASRMLAFYYAYKARIDSIGPGGARYGGAYYPRYYGEGSGCSAFIISFLDLGGLLRPEYEEWRVKLNLPLDLMGGPYHEGNEVRLRDVRKRKQWTNIHESTGYESFRIYDPMLIYEWILAALDNNTIEGSYDVIPLEIGMARGILIDARDTPAPVDEDIFIKREMPSVFIDTVR